MFKAHKEDKEEQLVLYSIIMISVLIILMAAYLVHKFYIKAEYENGVEEESYELFSEVK